MKDSCKVILSALFGNMLDYYDFMLFAHFGTVITNNFVPQDKFAYSHLIGLLFFAIPFIIRPLGGLFFGAIADRETRGNALSKTLKYASLSSFGIAILPGYEVLGAISILCFIFLRGLQGFSLGGEYTTAGTLLMEKFENHRGLLSGIVGASGSVGSFFAYLFSWFYLNDSLTEGAWRIAFILGSVMTYLSYVIRRKSQTDPSSFLKNDISIGVSLAHARLITLFTGILVSVTIWIPMVYVNFYLIQIQKHPISTGLNATLIALLGSVFFTPLMGYCADRVKKHVAFMCVGAFACIPLSFIGMALIRDSNLVGQVFLILAAVIFPAPMHAVMNDLFPRQIRSKNVNTFFMLGASIGSLVPALSGYFFETNALYYFPSIIISIAAVATLTVFYYSSSFGKLPKF